MEPLHIYSDVICPWCYVGKTRLDKALAKLQSQGKAVPDIYWHPYELNPDTPEGGENRVAYLESKYGPGRVEMMDQRLKDIGDAEGIAFHWDAASRIPNTFKAHRLIAFAQARGLGHALAGALFKAYFQDGRDVGDEATLVAIAEGSSLDGAALGAYFKGNQGVAELRQDEEEAQNGGLRGVPFYLINQHPLMGAQEVEVFMKVLMAEPHS
jgi:predicted DsbA family dithiol-disulfide isomerase